VYPRPGGGTLRALDGISFEVRAGEVFGFLGPNGAGKTTTVRVLATLLAPTSGAAEVAGMEVTPGNGPEVRRRISVMPETPGLYLKLSVRENLEFFAGLYGLPSRGVPAGIEESLAAIGLEDRADDLAGSLSKGLRQRAALARALLPAPAVLFLDEPTTGLDPAAAVKVRELIGGLRERGHTVFLTTHRLAEAEQLCDRVAILNTRLRSVGRPDELRKSLFRSALEVRVAQPLPDPGRLFGGIPGVEGWRTGDGAGAYVLEGGDPGKVAPEVARALVGAGADVLHLAEVEHSLEDVYLELIEEEG
ncbi:MAG: ATP-binding cassette domain-containing protein, partial [Acidimicrobiia bacterium]